MTSHSKRLSILAAPEIQDLYSIPKLNAQEQEYFFSLTDDELAIVNRLNTTRNRIHLILMLGYFRIKRVCLVYQWHEVIDIDACQFKLGELEALNGQRTHRGFIQ